MATCRLIEMNGRHEKGAAGQATPFDIPVTSPVRRTGDGRSVGLGLEIDGRVLAATIDFQFEVQTVTLVQGAHAGAFDSTDVDESVRLAVITLDEAEALHGVEELDRAAGAFAGQLTLRATLCTTETTGAGFARFTRRRTIGHGERFAVDDQIGRRHLATTIHQGEAERLTFGQTGQASLLDRADVNEHVFAAIVTNDEAETLLAVEELDDTLAFANDLGRHAATTAAAATKAATAAAEATAATAAETTAAAAGQMGVVRRDPFAMLPFIGYNMSDYFQHWLDLGKKVAAIDPAALPKIFCVNWFRTGEDGSFVWPGYGDNMRVLKWILDRTEGSAAAGNAHLFGTSPSYGDLNWDGVEFTEAQFTQITSIDKNAWAEELKLHGELFDKLAYRLPQELVDTRVRLERQLAD